MKSLPLRFLLVATASGLLHAESAPRPTSTSGSQADLTWTPHDLNRPRPPRMEPRPESELREKATAPAGAVILFSGQGLDAWNPTNWKSTPDYFEIVPGSGKAKPWLVSREHFGSCRLHLEWWTPPGLPPERSGQKRSNSGVFFMGNRYEVQILDSLDASTYADGMAGALYGQFPPLANALRPAGEWQYYDIEFHRPIFDASGALVRPARLTVDLNGIRVQQDSILTGPNAYKNRPPYQVHPDKLPLMIQDHGDVVRFRNIWVTPIAD